MVLEQGSPAKPARRLAKSATRLARETAGFAEELAKPAARFTFRHCCVIAWFHQFFNHPGQSRLLDGMHRYYHPKLRQKIENLKCDACQRYKVSSQGFGHLPPRDVRAAPWE